MSSLTPRVLFFLVGSSQITPLWHLRCCIICEIDNVARLNIWQWSSILVKLFTEWNGSSLKRSCLDWAYRRNGSIWQWRPFAWPLTPSSSMENLQVSSLHLVVSIKVTLFPYIFFFCMLKAFVYAIESHRNLVATRSSFMSWKGLYIPSFVCRWHPAFLWSSH